MVLWVIGSDSQRCPQSLSLIVSNLMLLSTRTVIRDHGIPWPPTLTTWLWFGQETMILPMRQRSCFWRDPLAWMTSESTSSDLNLFGYFWESAAGETPKGTSHPKTDSLRVANRWTWGDANGQHAIRTAWSKFVMLMCSNDKAKTVWHPELIYIATSGVLIIQASIWKCLAVAALRIAEVGGTWFNLSKLFLKSPPFVWKAAPSTFKSPKLGKDTRHSRLSGRDPNQLRPED